MSLNYLADAEPACKPMHRSSGRPPGPLERFAALAGGGAVLVTTARFGRSPVRDAAYQLRTRRRDLDLKLSWRMFAGLDDWGNRWPAEQGTFAAGLILSAAGDPVIERAVGRCLHDLAGLGRPLLWGVVSHRVRWHTRFSVRPNGWALDTMLPHPRGYARLGVTQGSVEFQPRFDPVLFPAEPDFFIFNSRLRWFDAHLFDCDAPPFDWQPRRA